MLNLYPVLSSTFIFNVMNTGNNNLRQLASLSSFKQITPLQFTCYHWFFFFFFLLRAASAACGSCQARGWIGAAATGLHHSHRNIGSKPHLWPTPQLTAMPGPLTHWVSPGIEPTSSWKLVRYYHSPLIFIFKYSQEILENSYIFA